eukprot:m.69583 g.69583  ORF g.69583 m.69583 type:complete len:174 (+) comp12841_c1_seq3:1405-1926(+)
MPLLLPLPPLPQRLQQAAGVCVLTAGPRAIPRSSFRGCTTTTARRRACALTGLSWATDLSFKFSPCSEPCPTTDTAPSTLLFQRDYHPTTPGQTHGHTSMSQLFFFFSFCFNGPFVGGNNHHEIIKKERRETVQQAKQGHAKSAHKETNIIQSQRHTHTHPVGVGECSKKKNS